MAVILKISGKIDSAFGKSELPISQYITEFDAEQVKKYSMIEKIFQTDTADSFGERLTYETTLQNFEPVGENGKYVQSDFEEGYSTDLDYETWKNSFQLSQETIEDGTIGKIAKDKSRALITSFYRTREMFASTLLANCTATSFKFGSNSKDFPIAAADGQPLFSKSHPSKVKKSLVQTNFFNLDTANGKIYDKIIAIETAMQNFKDDDGNPLMIMPDTLIIPNSPKIKKLVFEALNADGQPNTMNNDGNFIAGRFNVLVWNFAQRPVGATTDDWFIMLDSDWNQTYTTLAWRDRIKLTVRSTINDADDSNVWLGRARFGAKPHNWRGMALACDNTNATAIAV